MEFDVIEGRVVGGDASFGFLTCADTTDASVAIAVVAVLTPIAFAVASPCQHFPIGTDKFDTVDK